jgi:ATP-dependent exoDNAse (exonuclease V) beta subunit
MKKRPSILEMDELFAFPGEPEKPERPSGLPPDSTEREKALDVSQSWIVEAPAGSGKTGLLIQRYLKLLALPGVEEPEQILAITFTVKAAGEIRERVFEQLQRADGPDNTKEGFERQTREFALAVLSRDRALGWGLLEHPRRFNIRTIDSVCSEIARGLPVFSGSGAFSPVTDAGPLYRMAAERTLLQLGGADTALTEALRLILLHRDGDLASVRNLLAEMLALRDQWGRLVPLGRELLADDYLDQHVLPHIERTLAEVICQALSRLSRIIPPPLLHDLSMLAAEMGSQEGYKGNDSPIALCAGLRRVPAETAEDLDHWRALAHLLLTKDGTWRSSFARNFLRFEIDKYQVSRLQDIVGQLREIDGLPEALKEIATLPPPKYPPEQWRVAKALFRILYRALAELQVVFAERGECDFTEPGLVARAALRNEGSAFETVIGTRLQHLLVDEMQDTSTSQYELIQLLTQGWDGRSQTVFLVGDPKQSIYLFRQARVERFIRAMQQRRLGDIELGALYLTSNFRSQQALVRSFNEDFARLFPASISDEHPDEAPYVAAQATREASPESQNAVWHMQVTPVGSSRDDNKRIRRRKARQEAVAIRNVIDQWRARPLPAGKEAPWKIAVLVRTRIHLSEIVAELKRETNTPPIPFRAVEIESLSERREILDLLALTRALLHPADRVAWLAVLRAPWCGLELAELHTLTGNDDSGLFERTVAELILERGQELTEESCQRLARVWPILQAALKQSSRIPIAELVERTWRSLGGALSLSSEERSNARTYFELLDSFERNSSIDLPQLQSRLSKLYAETSTAPGAVDLLTIHSAKGLEWDLVLVPGLEKKPRSSGSRLLTWAEITSTEGESSMLLAPIAGKGQDSDALNQWMNRVQRSREDAESRRLFYVACTRAREELHLFASPDRKRDGSIARNYASLLQAAWAAAERHFVDTAVEARPLTAPVVNFPTPNEANQILPYLAAEAEQTRKAVLYRLPLDVLPTSHFTPIITPEVQQPSRPTGSFRRPEGSFEARAFGTTVHAFLEVLAADLAAGIEPTRLTEQINTWRPRIAAVLRNHGLPQSTAERLTERVHSALSATLRDPHGLWVLSAHQQASSERALTSWQEELSDLRLDRTFRAGPEPLQPGDQYLWIVDYKTTQYTGAQVDEFLLQERSKYTAQLDAYGRTMLTMTDSSHIRLALYYPLLPGFVWWPMDPD